MSIGQLWAQTNLRMGLHLNANSNDYSGNALNGTDTNIAYSNGVIGGNGASYNGSSSKIALSSSLDTPLKTASFTMLFVIKTGATVSFYGINRGIVLATEYYGIGLTGEGTSLTATRNQGDATSRVHTFSTTIATNTKYLVAWTYNKSSGASVIYLGNLATGVLLSSNKTLGTGNVAFNASYDDGYNLNAKLVGIADGYGYGTINEAIVFSDIKTASWIARYLSLLRGMY